MKLYFLPALALLLSLAEAIPVLSIQGNPAYSNCPPYISDPVISNLGADVNQVAIQNNITSPGSTAYTWVGQRFLRGNGDGERQLTSQYCINNGCPTNNGNPVCWIIPCYRRRELTTDDDSKSTDDDSKSVRELKTTNCNKLVNQAYSSLKKAAKAALSSSDPNAAACVALFQSIVISCQDD